MAAPPPVFSDLFNNPTKWDEPTPDYGALITLMLAARIGPFALMSICHYCYTAVYQEAEAISFGAFLLTDGQPVQSFKHTQATVVL